MNAYELADYIDLHKYHSNYGRIKEAIDTLRQQADRIAELENFHANCQNKKILGKPNEKKPLSHEEINKIIDNYVGQDIIPLIDFARAVEERHGIK